MKVPVVIINPESAGGETRRAWPKIASELVTHFGPFTCQFTEGSGQGTELAANAARQGVALIIACGGDGTISEVANGILASGANAELGILPSGTGGDFRRTLNIPNRARDAAKILKTGRTRVADVGRVTYINEDGEHESRYFLGVASFGMSADVIARLKDDSPKWLPTKGKLLGGRLSFAYVMLQSVAKTDPTRAIVQLDDEPERLMTVTNLCVANARYFGGGMKIAPNAKLADGRFDVISIGDLGAAKIVLNAPRLYAGAHLSMPEVGHALARNLTARPADPKIRVELEVDGELPGYLPATFHVLPNALRVRCPAPTP